MEELNYSELTDQDLVGLCAKYGISTRTLRRRLNRGNTLESSLTGKGLLKLRPTYAQPVEYLGVWYESYTALCLHYKVDYKLFMSRKDRGLSIEQALEGTDLPQGNSKSISYDGVTYPSIKALCADYNVNPTTFKSRFRSGYSMHSALTGDGIPSTKAKYLN